MDSDSSNDVVDYQYCKRNSRLADDGRLALANEIVGVGDLIPVSDSECLVALSNRSIV